MFRKQPLHGLAVLAWSSFLVQVAASAEDPAPAEPGRRSVSAPADVSVGLAFLRSRIEGEGIGVLLELPVVRAEVKLSPEQLARIESLGPGAIGERLETLESRSGSRKASTIKPGPRDLITPVQKRRLREIAFQVEGPRALALDEVQEYLNLDDDQRMLIGEIRREADSVLRSVDDERRRREEAFLEARRAENKELRFKDVQEFQTQSRAEFNGIRARAERESRRIAARSLRLLSRGQRSKLQKLQGQPFPLDRLLDLNMNTSKLDKPIVLEPIEPPGR